MLRVELWSEFDNQDWTSLILVILALLLYRWKQWVIHLGWGPWGLEAELRFVGCAATTDLLINQLQTLSLLQPVTHSSSIHGGGNNQTTRKDKKRFDVLVIQIQSFNSMKNGKLVS